MIEATVRPNIADFELLCPPLEKPWTGAHPYWPKVAEGGLLVARVAGNSALGRVLAGGGGRGTEGGVLGPVTNFKI